MKELKVYTAPTPDGKELADYCLKSESDREIARQKRKHSLENALFCDKLAKAYGLAASTHRGWKMAFFYDNKAQLWSKWQKRWLAIADEFKEEA